MYDVSMETTQQQMIRIANERGFEAEPNLTGGIAIKIPIDNNEVVILHAHNPNGLKLIFGGVHDENVEVGEKTRQWWMT